MIELRICAISDLHGFLPDVPDCDVLVIGGDIVDAAAASVQGQAVWLMSDFATWLHSFIERRIVVVGIAGNHDFIFQADERIAHRLPWIYLEDASVTLGGVKFYGTPWQPYFGNWAFNAPQVDPGEEFLRSKFDLIPADTDVLISHGPPAGILDRVGNRHVGSDALNRRIQEVMPRLVVTGHIHHCYGVEQVEDVTIANASITAVERNAYVLRNKPLLFDV